MHTTTNGTRDRGVFQLMPIEPFFRIKIDFKVTRALMESDFEFSQRYEKLLLALSVQEKDVSHEVFLQGQRKPSFIVLESKDRSVLQKAGQRVLQFIKDASASSSLLTH